MDAPYLHMDPSDIYPACDYYQPLATVRACRRCGKGRLDHRRCPDCGMRHFKLGQVLVRCRWNQRGTPPPGGYQISRTLQCVSCGHSPNYSGFVRRHR